SLDGQLRGIDLDTDLTVLLGSSPNGQSHVYTQALQLLDSLRASPSCNRLAASTLIHSCQSIDGSASEAEESQENLKSIYAAQLAICEIKDAGSRPPGTCEPFLPDRHLQLSRKLTEGSDQHGGAARPLMRKLGPCLQSLESRPQHWTSYSNNRQNAVVMCQAARIYIEKGRFIRLIRVMATRLTNSDNLIKLHESMVGATSGANSALAQAVTAAKEALMKQEEYGKEVKRFQQQVMQDLEASKAETQSYLGNLLKHVESALQSATKQFSGKMKIIEKEADNVGEALSSHATEAKELKSNIGRLFQQAVEGSAELAATQAKQWDATSSSAVELQNSLQSLREQEVHSLLGAFDSIHNQLRASNELVAVMYSRQNEMDKRLLNLDKSFASLESTAAALHATQTADAESQLRLHNQVQIGLQVAQGILTDITASAATLQATVHDTSSKVTNMVAFGGFSSMVLNWGWSLIMIFLLYQFHPKLGGYAAVVLGKGSTSSYRLSYLTIVGMFLLTSISGPPPFISHLHPAATYNIFGLSVPIDRAYHVVLWLLGFAGIALVFRLSPRLQCLTQTVSCRAKACLPFGMTSPGRAHHSWKI
ncbi:MAG: hypothetical protein LQ338_007140, partial [Usnochroma carphineum]